MPTPSSCPACQRPLPAAARFCPECGARVATEVGPEGARPPPARPTPAIEERRARGISVAAIVVVATVFAVVGVSDWLLQREGHAAWATATGVATAVLWVVLMLALVGWTVRRRRRGSREVRT